jgi:hypothetical protein
MIFPRACLTFGSRLDGYRYADTAHMTEQPAKNVVTGFMAKPRDTAADTITGRLDGPSGPGRPVLVTKASYPRPRLPQPAAGVAGYPDLLISSAMDQGVLIRSCSSRSRIPVEYIEGAEERTTYQLAVNL